MLMEQPSAIRTGKRDFHSSFRVMREGGFFISYPVQDLDLGVRIS